MEPLRQRHSASRQTQRLTHGPVNVRQGSFVDGRRPFPIQWVMSNQTDTSFTPVPGCVYRTRTLRDSIGPGWRDRLRAYVESGALKRIRRGLYACYTQTRWGAAPPNDHALLRAFLDGGRFLITGSGPWNALRLGSTAVFAVTLVYNDKRSGEFTIGGRRYFLRRVRFPEEPTPEWYAIDLINNRAMAGLDLETIRRLLPLLVASGVLDPDRLYYAARDFGHKEARDLLVAG
jgi:hypothetical protein